MRPSYKETWLDDLATTIWGGIALIGAGVIVLVAYEAGTVLQSIIEVPAL